MINKKISIITVCYNSKDTIERAILSVINQKYNNIEYIIIDGGSTDGTLEIIDKYKKYVAFFSSEPDSGIYNAMNKGLTHVSGDIIGILNSDDWYEQDILSKIAYNYGLYKSDNCIFHGNMNFHKNEKIRLCRPSKDPRSLVKGTIFFHPTMFVKKYVYNQIGTYNEKYRIAADYEFMVRAMKSDVKYVYIDSIITNMSSGGESDINIIKGYREVLDISIFYKLNRFKSFFYFLKKTLKSLLVILKDKIYAK